MGRDRPAKSVEIAPGPALEIGRTIEWRRMTSREHVWVDGKIRELQANFNGITDVDKNGPFVLIVLNYIETDVVLFS